MIFDNTSSRYIRELAISILGRYIHVGVQFILFGEAVIGAGIGLCIIQTAVYTRVESLCVANLCVRVHTRM